MDGGIKPAMMDKYPFARFSILSAVVAVMHWRRNIQALRSYDQFFTVNPSVIFFRPISLTFWRLSLD
jgi:hypothetical protein